MVKQKGILNGKRTLATTIATAVLVGGGLNYLPTQLNIANGNNLTVHADEVTFTDTNGLVYTEKEGGLYLSSVPSDYGSTKITIPENIEGKPVVGLNTGALSDASNVALKNLEELDLSKTKIKYMSDSVNRVANLSNLKVIKYPETLEVCTLDFTGMSTLIDSDFRDTKLKVLSIYPKTTTISSLPSGSTLNKDTLKLPDTLEVFGTLKDASNLSNISNIDLSGLINLESLSIYFAKNITNLVGFKLPDSLELFYSTLKESNGTYTFVYPSTSEYITFSSSKLKTVDFFNTSVTDLPTLYYVYGTELDLLRYPKTLGLQSKNGVTLHSNVNVASSGKLKIKDLDLSSFESPDDAIGRLNLTNAELEKTTLPEGLTKLSSNLFSNATFNKTASIIFPTTLETIDAYALKQNTLPSIDLSSTKIKELKEKTFYSYSSTVPTDVANNMNLTSILLPPTLESIGANVFSNNYKLKTVKVVGEPNIKSIGAGAFNGTYVSEFSEGILSKVESIGSKAFYGAKLSILNSLKDNRVLTELGSNAFAKGTMTDITTGISVDLSNTQLTYLPNNVFSGITSLKEVSLPSTLKKIEDSTFLDSRVTKINLPEGLETIGASAFKGTNALSSVVIPDSVKTIGENAFEGSGLYTLKIGAGLKAVGRGVFKDIKVQNLVIPSTVNSVYAEAFGGTTSPKSVVVYNTSLYYENGASSLDVFSGNPVIYVERGSSTDTSYDTRIKYFPTISSDIDSTVEYRNTVTPTFTVTDADSYTVLLNGENYTVGTPITSEGEHILTVTAVNSVMDRTKEFKLKVIKTPKPTIETKLVMGGVYKNYVEPSFDVKDSNKVTYTLDGKTYNGSARITGEGEHKLLVNAYHETEPTIQEYVFNIENTPKPKITSTLAKGATYKNSVTPEFSVTNEVETRYTLDGVDYELGTPIDTLGLHKLTVVSKHDLGDVTETYNFTVKEYKPPVSLKPLKDITTTVDTIAELDLSEYFGKAKEDDEVTYTIESDDEVGAKVWVTKSGLLRFVSPYKGSYSISIVAKGKYGDTEENKFKIKVLKDNEEVSTDTDSTLEETDNSEETTVPTAPTIKTSITNKTGEQGVLTKIDLSEHFNTIEGSKGNTYIVKSEDNKVAEAWVDDKGVLKIVGNYADDTEITVTAKNEKGTSEPIVFKYTTTKAKNDATIIVTGGGTSGSTGTGTVGGSTETTPTGKAVNIVQNINISELGKEYRVNLDGLFPNLDLSTSTLTVTNLDDSDVKVKQSGGILSLTGLQNGFSSVTVKVKDNKGTIHTGQFLVYVTASSISGNTGIIEASSLNIPDSEIIKGEQVYTVGLADVFGTTTNLQDVDGYNVTLTDLGTVDTLGLLSNQKQPKTINLLSNNSLLEGVLSDLPVSVTVNGKVESKNVKAAVVNNQLMLEGINLGTTKVSIQPKVKGNNISKPVEFHLKVVDKKDFSGNNNLGNSISGDAQEGNTGNTQTPPTTETNYTSNMTYNDYKVVNNNALESKVTDYEALKDRLEGVPTKDDVAKLIDLVNKFGSLADNSLSRGDLSRVINYMTTNNYGSVFGGIQASLEAQQKEKEPKKAESTGAWSIFINFIKTKLGK